MKKNRIVFSIILAVASFQIASAQLAKQKGITADQIQKHLNQLIYKKDSGSKAELTKEIKALVNSDKENFMSIGAEAYGYLGMDNEETAVKRAIFKRFPKGILARAHTFLKFAENNSLSASDAEKLYQQWLAAFPVSNFKKYEREIYNSAAAHLAIKFGQENNQERFDFYVSQLRSKPGFLQYVSEITSALCLVNNYKMALPVLEEGFNMPRPSEHAKENEKDNYELYHENIKWDYARALIEIGQTDKGVALFEQFEAERPGDGSYDWRNTAFYAKGLNAKGKVVAAFQLLEKYLMAYGRNDELEKLQADIYHQINGDKGDYNAYLTSLTESIDKAQLSKIKSGMLKKEAPMFDLEDRAEKRVSLADLKGKVVVLDFWATWCGPCKASFPPMQAAVNKYKDDQDVVFLFVSTGERAENYKELVAEYIDTNKFSFHVLFDEMKDRNKATASAYGVRGIPTKFIIDKQGFIRFQLGAGSFDMDKDVYEISTMIELAKKE